MPGLAVRLTSGVIRTEGRSSAAPSRSSAPPGPHCTNAMPDTRQATVRAPVSSHDASTGGIRWWTSDFDFGRYVPPRTGKAAHEGGPSSSTVVGFAAHEHSVG